MLQTRPITLPGPFDGVVLDMDGTLVDTEPLWRIAKERMFARYATTFEHRDHVAVFGRDEAFTTVYLQERLGQPVERRDAVRLEYRDLVAGIFAEGVPVRPGVHALLRSLRGRVPLALATNTIAPIVDIALERSGLRPYLDAICTAESGAAKPAPDIYLAACAAIGVAPARAVAIEDSPTGIAAAKAAGMTCIAVPSEATDGLDAADHIVGSLADLVADGPAAG